MLIKGYLIQSTFLKIENIDFLMNTYQVTNVLLEQIVGEVNQRIDAVQLACMNQAKQWSLQFMNYLTNQNFFFFDKPNIFQDGEIRNQPTRTRAKIVQVQTIPTLQFARKPSSSPQRYEKTQRSYAKRQVSQKKIAKNYDRFIKIENHQSKTEKKLKKFRFFQQVSINVDQKQKEGFCSNFSRSFKSLSRITQNRNSNQTNVGEFMNPVIVGHHIGAQKKLSSKSEYAFPRLLKLKSNSSKEKSTKKTIAIPQLKLTLKREQTKTSDSSKKISIRTTPISSRRESKQNIENFQPMKKQNKLIIERVRPPKYSCIHIINKVKAKQIFPEINLNRFQNN